MSQSLQVVALISGGKDSFYSLLHCLHNDHHVVALANLYATTEPETSDLNSYMYQTVGHAMIPLHAEALGLPLYRRQISGSAINREKDYYPVDPGSNKDGATSTAENTEDETESLLRLLEEVKAAHPTANAVSSGAILSTYQRTRIESVALRLGLIPLSYLWQYPSLPTPIPRIGGLLDDMAAVDLDARIVKVASGGLGEELLWGSLKDQKVRQKVEKAVARFGGSVLGEGGEYETLVVSGPRPVWKRDLAVKEGARHIIKAEGGEYWISFKEGSLIGSTNGADLHDWRRNLRIPELWDRQFANLSKNIDVIKSTTYQEDAAGQREFSIREGWIALEDVTRTDYSLSVSNIVSSSTEVDVKEQMISIHACLIRILKIHQAFPDDVVFTTLLLRSMENFAVVNGVYASLFNKPNPPARVTVACGDTLPAGVQVMASFVIDLCPRKPRIGLHVQSRSYWAPANIGPYSQAISVPIPGALPENGKEACLVYVAGQIPLVPASLEILPPPNNDGDDFPDPELLAFWEQTCLSLQHLWRIGIKTSVTSWAYGIAFITGNHIKRKAKLAFQAWKMLHERGIVQDEEDREDVSLDIWDRTHGGQSTFAVNTQDRGIPDFDSFARGTDTDQALPGFLAVQVDELPRSCAIEWQGLGITQNVKIKIFRSSSETTIHYGATSKYEECISTMYVQATISDEELVSHPVFAQQAEHCTHPTIYTPYPRLLGDKRAQIVPCRSVWGEDAAELVVGMVQHVNILKKAAYHNG